MNAVISHQQNTHDKSYTLSLLWENKLLSLPQNTDILEEKNAK